MPITCAVVGCCSRGSRDSVKFFRFPSIYKHGDKRKTMYPIALERRNKWVAAVRRAHLTEKKIKYQRVCSKHFFSGKPADIADVDHPDWVPSLNMGYKTMGKSLVRNNGVAKTSSTANNVVPTRHLVEINQISNENTSSAIEDGVDPLPLNHSSTYLKSDDEYDDDDDEIDFEENERLNIPNLQVKSEPGLSSDSTNCTDVIVKIEPDSKSSMHEIKLNIKNDETELLFYCFAQSVKKLSPYYHAMAKTEVAALLSRIEVINSTDPR